MARQYVIKGEAAISQPVSPGDNAQWENTSQEMRDLFISDMQRELTLSIKQLCGEDAVAFARVWMEVIETPDEVEQ